MTVTSAIRILAGVAFFAGMLTVAVLSLLPQDAVPQVDLSDKLQHLIAYLCVALAGGIAFPEGRFPIVLGLVLVVLGVGIEGAQAFIPGRFASVGDAVANTFGVLIGVALARVAGARGGLLG